MAAFDAHTGQIVGSAYRQIRTWLVNHLQPNCINPDGTHVGFGPKTDVKPVSLRG